MRRSLSIFAIFLFLFSNVSFVQPVFAEDVISVEEAITNNDGSKTVEGYIVGFVVSENNVTTDSTQFKQTNFALATNKGETDTNNMLYVQVTKDFRNQFGLEANPEIVGEKVIVTGDLEEYFKKPGLKNPTEIKFSDDVEPEEPTEPGEIEPIAINDAREQETGQVTVTGTITAKLKNTLQIQDDTGALAVRPVSLNVDIGDEVTVHGSLLDYRGLLQLDQAEVIEKHGEKKVTSTVITAAELGEETESQLVTVKDVSLTFDQQGDGWANYTATDGEAEFVVRDETGVLPLEVGNTYDSITGIVIQFDETFQIVPRNQQDIVQNENQVQPVFATPTSGSIPTGTEVILNSLTNDVEIFYTIDGSEPTKEHGMRYENPIVVEEAMTIRSIAYKDGQEDSEITEFAYTVYDAEKGIQIHDIQGDGHTSPFNGSVVKDIEGIVTYKYDIRGSNYFHLQSEEENYDGDKNTSEAIIVYTGRAENIDVGDKVKIEGRVDEYYIDGYDDKEKTDLSITQINARNDRGGSIEVLENNVELPTPITITSSDIPDRIIGKDGFNTFNRDENAIDYWESLEGMLVEVPPAKAVAPQEHGDLVVVTNEFETDTIHGGVLFKDRNPNAQFIQYKLQPNTTARGFKVKTGDLFTEEITGVVNYGFQNYKVYADLADLEAAFKEGTTKPQETTIVKDGDKLSIATYNVENFSANTSETSNEKAANIARAIVQDMDEPDIIGLIEMQDDNGTENGPDDADATKTFERLIKVIQEAGGPTYDYVNVNPNYNEDGGAPNSNIRVGFIYNADRVSLVEGEIGVADETVAYMDGTLTLNPGRIGPNEEAFASSRKPLAAQFEFNGETVVAIANHLNSKRGDQALFGKNQPPKLVSEAQRMEQTKILNDFVKDIQVDNPDENIIVLGDMNDYEFSNPVQTLKGDELTNLIDLVPENERYTYVFQGNSQVLDHILVSNNLADVSDVDILHVNADFTPMHGRASDHEPVLAQIDLTKKDEEEPEEPEEPKNPEGPENPETPSDEGASKGKKDENKTNSENDTKSNNENSVVISSDDGDNKGSLLPSTATGTYTILLIGSILVIVGAGFYIVRRIRTN